MSVNNNDRAKDYVVEPHTDPPPYGGQNMPPYGGQNVQPIQYAPQAPNVVMYASPGLYTCMTNTTVVVTQPGATQKPAPRMWSTGIFNCFDDCSSALAVCFCSYCYACHLADKMGETCCLPFCVPNYLTLLRTKMRAQNNIEGSICNDCIMSHFCGLCVMCQLSRELDYVKSHPV